MHFSYETMHFSYETMHFSYETCSINVNPLFHAAIKEKLF